MEKDAVIFNRQPPELQNKCKEQQKQLDDDSRLVFHEFNVFLRNNKQNEVNYNNFKKILDIYFAYFVNKKIQVVQTSLGKRAEDFGILELILALLNKIFHIRLKK